MHAHAALQGLLASNRLFVFQLYIKLKFKGHNLLDGFSSKASKIHNR